MPAKEKSDKPPKNPVGAPARIDHSLVQGLYMQGFTPKEIERQTGVKARTISHLATTKGWHAAKQSADELLAEIPFELRARKLKSDQLQIVENQTDVLLDNSPSTIADLNKQMLSTKTVVELSAKLCNWDSEKKAPLINLTFLSSPPEKVIDISRCLPLEDESDTSS